MHPESLRPLMCHEPPSLTADLTDHLFHIWLSEEGSNKRRVEERVVPFWRDYLQDVEGKCWCFHVLMFSCFRLFLKWEVLTPSCAPCIIFVSLR